MVVEDEVDDEDDRDEGDVDDEDDDDDAVDQSYVICSYFQGFILRDAHY